MNNLALTFDVQEWRRTLFWAALATAVASVWWVAVGWRVESSNLAVWVFMGLSLSIGLAHGAVDVWLIVRCFSGRAWRVWAAYGASVMLVAAALISWPDAALAILLLLSIWHFGEYFEAQSGAHAWLTRWVRGGAALALPYTFSHTPLASLVQQIAGPGLGQWGMSWLVWTMVAWFWWPALLIWLVQSRKLLLGDRRVVSLELVLLLLLNLQLPPLAAFSLYFGLYHSGAHLARVWQRERLQAKNAWASLGFTLLLTWVLVGLLAWYANGLYGWDTVWRGDWTKPALQLLVVLLTAVSVPHIVLIGHWARRTA